MIAVNDSGSKCTGSGSTTVRAGWVIVGVVGLGLAVLEWLALVAAGPEVLRCGALVPTFRSTIAATATATAAAARTASASERRRGGRRTARAGTTGERGAPRA